MTTHDAWNRLVMQLAPSSSCCSQVPDARSVRRFTAQIKLLLTLTRSPPIITGARRYDAPLNLEISANVVCVISGDLASNQCRIIRLSLCMLGPFYAILCCIHSHFAADRKKPLTSYPVYLGAILSAIKFQNSVKLDWIVAEKLAFKLAETEFSTTFSR